jgi:ankyrin repeat protein
VQEGKGEVKAHRENWTPLLAAVNFKHLDVATYLVEECGVSVNETDANGVSALYMAAYKNDLVMIQKLLEWGADPWIKGLSGSTLLHVCAERNFHEAAKLVLDFNPEKNSPLIFEQTDLQEIDQHTGGDTALHVACEWNSTEMIELLCEKGGEKLIRI